MMYDGLRYRFSKSGVRGAVNNWYGGKKNLSPRMAEAMEKVLGVSLGELFGAVAEKLPEMLVTKRETSQDKILDDLNEIIMRQDIDFTTRETLVNARVGQGRFRLEVLQSWDNRCSLTGSTCDRVIRASHIKPWRESTDEERLDPQNGIPLVATFDALFDAGLISFQANGRLIVSPNLSTADRHIFGIDKQTLTKTPTARMAMYLAYHRSKYGFED
jgi:transcriptional regulator with XRE-family HTH domain